VSAPRIHDDRHAIAPDASDEAHMRHALGLAALGLNTTDPNPRVGCVLVRDGRVVGEGWHERAGGPHAEVCALESAGDAARGATAYLTLEPCAAQGRTPPCTAALIEAGVARVVYAVADPDPRMKGGAALLRAAGLAVSGGLLATEARELNVGFFSRHERARPWVRVKLGASLDGRTALANGASRWITGARARADVQLYRARSSVVLTGSGTVLADDPELNVRLQGAARQPLRVVLDRTLRVPPEARVYAGAGPAAVFTATPDAGQRQALERHGVSVEVLPATADGIDLAAALARLAAWPANEVWVEAGPRLAGALLVADLVDELVVYVAPCLLGPQARPLAELPLLEDLGRRLSLRFHSVERLGEDLRIIARPGTHAGDQADGNA
jgi:diaminohydroxyphosphoribosylaminopyrimidine deaminase / 5-amino-6-(5-phosphoribosylamino)uracil reductase